LRRSLRLMTAGWMAPGDKRCETGTRGQITWVVVRRLPIRHGCAFPRQDSSEFCILLSLT
jgi:hypothetical protein